MKTTYQSQNPTDTRKSLQVVRTNVTDDAMNVYFNPETNNIFVGHDIDDGDRVDIQATQGVGVYLHSKINGTWTTTPQAISIGGTGATNRRLAAANLGLELVDGQEINRTAIIAMGFISNSSKQLQLEMPINLHTYGVHSVTVKALHGVLRGVSGYLDNNNGDRDFTKSPFSYKIYFKYTGMLMLIIDKTSAFTNVVNNTPVSVALTYDFVFHDAYPT